MGFIENFIGNSTKLELKFTKDSYKNDLDKLDQIFFNAIPGCWSYVEHKGYRCSDPSDEYMLVKYIRDGYINIYESKYKLYHNPKTREEIIEYEHLREMGKCRSDNRTDLYWDAYNILKEIGYTYKQSHSVTTFMSIFKLANKEISVNNYIELSDRYGNEVEDVLLRCGDIDAYRTLDELNRNKYLILFPFLKDICIGYKNRLDIDNGKMYILEITGIGKNLYNKYLDDRSGSVF